MKKQLLLVLAVTFGFGLLFSPFPVAAQSDQGQFSLQVSPSPLVATVTPGEKQDLELSIRNTNTKKEDLTMNLRSFSIDEKTGQVEISDNEPDGITEWITFGAKDFSVEPGSVYLQKILLDVPKDAGFSYSFAITIQRKDESVEAKKGVTQIRGSVAVFTLLSVDKPGASRAFEVVELRSSKRVYEYLPATFDISIKNTGNTIVQPYGNIYIQRSEDDDSPITTLPLNKNTSYLLPDTSRTLSVDWQEGFPIYESVKVADNAEPKQRLRWDWSKAHQFRFGRYTAVVVAVYNDGTRDIPIRAVMSFWVIPWKLLLGVGVAFLFVAIGIIVSTKRMIRPLRKRRNRQVKHETESTEEV